MGNDDNMKFVRDKIASGEPIVTTVIEPPFKIELLAGGLLQIDAPLGIAGFENAAVQRFVIAVSSEMLRGALAYLENNPDAGPLELTKKQSAN